VTLEVVQMGKESDAAAASLEPLRSGLHLLAVRALGTADAAEEAVQETLARAVSALARGQLADPAKLAAFVAGIARHVVIDMVRARRRLVSLDALPSEAHPSHDPDALGALVTAGEQALVRAALALLAVSDRDLLRLCYVEGLAPGEIAKRTGEPPERIRKRKSRAVERLREAFRSASATRHAEARPPTREAGATGWDRT
jgi:RNA polymerase sigma factor (sigma-70 family)